MDFRDFKVNRRVKNANLNRILSNLVFPRPTYHLDISYLVGEVRENVRISVEELSEILVLISIFYGRKLLNKNENKKNPAKQEEAV